MMKKLSVFFTTPFKQRLERDKAFRKCIAVREALREPFTILELGIPFIGTEAPVVDPYKPFDRSRRIRAERRTLAAMLERAARVEATISLAHDTVSVAVRFFEKGRMAYFAVHSVDFDALDAESVLVTEGRGM